MNTSDHVHHLLVYKCHNFRDSSAANESNMCHQVHEEARFCRANLLIAGWAVGAGVSKTNFIYIYICTWTMWVCWVMYVPYIHHFTSRNFLILRMWHILLVGTEVTCIYLLKYIMIIPEWRQVHQHLSNNSVCLYSVVHKVKSYSIATTSVLCQLHKAQLG